MAFKTGRLATSVIAASIALTLTTLGCGQQKTARNNLDEQNLADSQARYDELAPAEGLFVGAVHLRSGKDYCMIIELERIHETVRAPNSPNGTDAVDVPKIAGNVRFPAIKDLSSLDLSQYADLLDPLGGFASALVDFGDYSPKTNVLILPYAIPSYSQGSFGELSGILSGDVFRGSWFSKPFGQVGTFTLKRNPAGGTRCEGDT